MRTMIIAAALAAATSPAVAQTVNTGNLVTVTIDDVSILNNSLNQNELELLSRNNIAVPIQVQVPVAIAANVCPNVNVAALTQQIRQGGTATCTANSGSRALGQQVLRQAVRGNR